MGAGVAFGGSGQPVATRLLSPGQSRDAMLAKMVEALKPSLKPMPQRYNSAYFEVYVTDGVNNDIAAARTKGSAIGFVEYDPMFEEVTAEQVGECGADFGYPLQEDVFLGETLDVSDLGSWSTRKILRTLDRLMEEHWFIDAHGLMSPFDDYGAEMSRSHDAAIRNELQPHARVSDRVWTRIFALCTILMERGQLHLASEFELDFAANCSDIEPADHPGIPGWLILQWDSLLAKLENRRPG